MPARNTGTGIRTSHPHCWLTRPPHRHQIVHINRLKPCIVRPHRLTGNTEEPVSKCLPPTPPRQLSASGRTYIPDATDRLYAEDEDELGMEQWYPAGAFVVPPQVLPVPGAGAQGARQRPPRNAERRVWSCPVFRLPVSFYRITLFDHRL